MSAPLPVGELLDRTWRRLGGYALYWPAEEVLANGLNPAQRLVTLLNPVLLTRRTLVTLLTNEAFIDLRQAAPRCMRVRRIVLGDVTADDPRQSTVVGKFKQLEPTTLNGLSWHKDWWNKTGVPTHWYAHGAFLVGIWRRIATSTLQLTVIYEALPLPFDLTTPTQVSDLPVAWHPLLPDIAAALLTMKEGQTEAQRAAQHLSEVLGAEPLLMLQKALQRLSRQQLAAPVGGGVG